MSCKAAMDLEGCKEAVIRFADSGCYIRELRPLDGRVLCSGYFSILSICCIFVVIQQQIWHHKRDIHGPVMLALVSKCPSMSKM